LYSIDLANNVDMYSIGKVDFRYRMLILSVAGAEPPRRTALHELTCPATPQESRTNFTYIVFAQRTYIKNTRKRPRTKAQAPWSA